MEISATSFDRQTFTFTNPQITQDLSKMIDPAKRLAVLFVANNIEGRTPESGISINQCIHCSWDGNVVGFFWFKSEPARVEVVEISGFYRAECSLFTSSDSKNRLIL